MAWARGLWLILMVGCGEPGWPVPVPPEKGHDRETQRVEAPLPLCGGQSMCSERAALDALLAAHRERCGGAATPASVTQLLGALGRPEATARSEAFPDVAALPAAVRGEERVEARDARATTEDDSAAFVHCGIWWTFWDRTALTEDPEASSGWSHLIVFPEFEGRDACDCWGGH